MISLTLHYIEVACNVLKLCDGTSEIMQIKSPFAALLW